MYIYHHHHQYIGAEWPAGADHREGAEEQDQGEMFEEEDEWKDYYESRGVMYDTDSERDEEVYYMYDTDECMCMYTCA